MFKSRKKLLAGGGYLILTFACIISLLNNDANKPVIKSETETSSITTFESTSKEVPPTVTTEAVTTSISRNRDIETAVITTNIGSPPSQSSKITSSGEETTQKIRETTSKKSKPKQITSEVVPSETVVQIETTTTLETETENILVPAPEWTGVVLNQFNGKVLGPSGYETFYNMDMSHIVENLQALEEYKNYSYWERSDGVKMIGPYVMCASNFDIRPFGSKIETTLGTAVVCDTGSFTSWDATGVDIAVNWY